MKRFHEQTGAFVCPHTAVGLAALETLEADGDRPEGGWVVAATAHPSKFNEVIEDVVGAPAPMAPALQALADRPTSLEDLDADYSALRTRIEGFCSASAK